MATWYLLNSTRFGTQFLHAGSYVDDSLMDTTGLSTAGGKLWPSTDTIVATAAARAQALRAQGQSGSVLDDIMEAAVFASQNSTAHASGASNIDIEDAANIIAATNVEAALAELALKGARFARCVITTIAAYTGSGTGTLTASANGAIGAQDTNCTLAAGDRVFLPAVTGGAGGTTVAKDTGLWMVVSAGGSGKFQLTRPPEYAHGATLALAQDVIIGGEGATWGGNTWRSQAAAGKVVDTDDPLYYPRKQTKTGAVGSQMTGLYALATAGISPIDTTAAHPVAYTLGAGTAPGTQTLDFTGTGTDAVVATVTNF